MIELQTGKKMSKSAKTVLRCLAIITLIAVAILCIWSAIGPMGRKVPYALTCKTNMEGLRTALSVYANKSENKLPHANWCDLLITEADVIPRQFICLASNCIEGKDSCYALNIEVAGKDIDELPGDLVLFFDTKPGWNQIGGPELINLVSHGGRGGKNCGILFANGDCLFLKNKIDQLRWKIGKEITPLAGDLRPKDWATSVEKTGCGNLHKVSDVLFRGEQPTEEGFKELEKMGIKTVLNLRIYDIDRYRLKTTSLGYEHISMPTWENEFDEVSALKIMTDKTKQPVFVYCVNGANRTGLVTAIYRIVEQGWDKEKAIKEMREGGFGFYDIWEDMPEYIRQLDVAELKEQL